MKKEKSKSNVTPSPTQGEKDVQKQSTEYNEQVPRKHLHGETEENDDRAARKHPHGFKTPVALWNKDAKNEKK